MTIGKTTFYQSGEEDYSVSFSITSIEYTYGHFCRSLSEQIRLLTTYIDMFFEECDAILEQANRLKQEEFAQFIGLARMWEA